MKTTAQRYNRRLNEIFDEPIKNMKKCEAIAEDILQELEKKVDIDPCGLERHHVINLISRIINAKTTPKP